MWKMLCDRVLCERWCVTKMVCDKDGVCERWCETKMVCQKYVCGKDGVRQR